MLTLSPAAASHPTQRTPTQLRVLNWRVHSWSARLGFFGLSGPLSARLVRPVPANPGRLGVNVAVRCRLGPSGDASSVDSPG